jgi:hypothetical protein
MRVTIVRRPEGAVGGMWLASLQVGQTYNLTEGVAGDLILEGFAIQERRRQERRQARRPESPGRRRDD